MQALLETYPRESLYLLAGFQEGELAERQEPRLPSELQDLLGGLGDVLGPVAEPQLPQLCFNPLPREYLQGREAVEVLGLVATDASPVGLAQLLNLPRLDTSEWEHSRVKHKESTRALGLAFGHIDSRTRNSDCRRTKLGQRTTIAWPKKSAANSDVNAPFIDPSGDSCLEPGIAFNEFCDRFMNSFQTRLGSVERELLFLPGVSFGFEDINY